MIMPGTGKSDMDILSCYGEVLRYSEDGKIIFSYNKDAYKGTPTNILQGIRQMLEVVILEIEDE